MYLTAVAPSKHPRAALETSPSWIPEDAHVMTRFFATASSCEGAPEWTPMLPARVFRFTLGERNKWILAGTTQTGDNKAERQHRETPTGTDHKRLSSTLTGAHLPDRDPVSSPEQTQVRRLSPDKVCYTLNSHWFEDRWSKLTLKSAATS